MLGSVLGNTRLSLQQGGNCECFLRWKIWQHNVILVRGREIPLSDLNLSPALCLALPCEVDVGIILYIVYVLMQYNFLNKFTFLHVLDREFSYGKFASDICLFNRFKQCPTLNE